MEEKETQKLCENFLKKFMDEDMKGAVDLTRSNTRISETALDNLTKTAVEQLPLLRTYGKAIEYELLDKTVVKSAVIKYSYVLKFEKTPLRFQFIFYNPQKEWKLNDIDWTDKIEKVFV